MDKTKKNEVITFRTSAETKALLEIIANAKEWSLSKLCEKIITQYAEEHKPR